MIAVVIKAQAKLTFQLFPRLVTLITEMYMYSVPIASD